MIEFIEKEVLKSTCSKSLLRAIKKSNQKFTSFDLLLLSFRYAKSYTRQIELLKLISENTLDERTKVQALECIKYKEDEYQEFVSLKEDNLFDLIVSASKINHECRYLTKVCGIAFEKLKDLVSHYKSINMKILYRTIIKRKVNDNADGKDQVGYASFDENFQLLEVCCHKYDYKRKTLAPSCNCWKNAQESVDDECFLHRQVRFPKFIKNLDLIHYQPVNDTLGESEYAINIDWDDDDGSEVLKSAQNLCIPLDTRISKCSTKNALLNAHTHVEYVHINLAEPSELPESIQKIYRKVLKILLK